MGCDGLGIRSLYTQIPLAWRCSVTLSLTLCLVWKGNSDQTKTNNWSLLRKGMDGTGTGCFLGKVQ